LVPCLASDATGRVPNRKSDLAPDANEPAPEGGLIAASWPKPQVAPRLARPVSDLADVQGLGALPAGADLELHGLALIEASVALTLDIGVVDEDIFLAFYGEEPVALFTVEKLHCAVRHYRYRFRLNWI